MSTPHGGAGLPAAPPAPLVAVTIRFPPGGAALPLPALLGLFAQHVGPVAHAMQLFEPSAPQPEVTLLTFPDPATAARAVALSGRPGPAGALEIQLADKAALQRLATPLYKALRSVGQGLGGPARRASRPLHPRRRAAAQSRKEPASRVVMLVSCACRLAAGPARQAVSTICSPCGPAGRAAWLLRRHPAAAAGRAGCPAAPPSPPGFRGGCQRPAPACPASAKRASSLPQRSAAPWAATGSSPAAAARPGPARQLRPVALPAPATRGRPRPAATPAGSGPGRRSRPCQRRVTDAGPCPALRSAACGPAAHCPAGGSSCTAAPAPAPSCR